jgi:hypothetical protein
MLIFEFTITKSFFRDRINLTLFAESKLVSFYNQKLNPKNVNLVKSIVFGPVFVGKNS